MCERTSIVNGDRHARNHTSIVNGDRHKGKKRWGTGVPRVREVMSFSQPLAFYGHTV